MSDDPQRPPSGDRPGQQPPPPPEYAPQQQVHGQQPYGQQQPYGYQPYQGADTYRSGASGPRASFGRRLVAAIIDGLIVVIPIWILSALLGTSLVNFDVQVNETTGEVTSFDAGAGTGLFLVFILLSVALSVGYYVFFEGGDSGQTVGKRALGIRVIRGDGGPLGYGVATGRFFARYLSTALCYLGYFWMLWDREKQTWHDKICNSYVVPTDAYPVQPRT